LDSLCAACSQRVIPYSEVFIDKLTVVQLIQEIPPIIRNAKVYYLVHKNTPLALIQSKFNTAHTMPYPSRPVIII